MLVPRAPQKKAPKVKVRRERTAMQRYSCSKPIAVALADGIITKETAVFDYGCGLGADLKYLGSRGIKAKGWDPHYEPKAKIGSAEVVNLGYVLNVIEDARERDDALRGAFKLAKKALIVSVRVDQVPESFTEYGDGYLTAKDTFQKLYTQSEFRGYLESSLERRAHVASLGIAYVFADETAEAEFVASRAFARRLEYRTDLIEEFAKNKLAKKYVRLANKLGRVPQPDEFKEYEELLEAFGSPVRIQRLLLHHINRDAFDGSQAQRREDILTYLAMMRLQGIKPPKLGYLPQSVSRDIKAIWPNYRVARDEGERFLFSLGQPAFVKATCVEAGVGKLLPGDLYVHRSAEDDLPALLRVLLYAAQRIVGTVEYDIAKISTEGRAVSFLRYEDFDDDPHPALVQSIRVYLPRAAYGILEYGESNNPPILHRKETFVGPSYPRYEEFKALTDAEEELSLLSAPDIGRRKEWNDLLEARRLVIEGHTIRRLS